MATTIKPQRRPFQERAFKQNKHPKEKAAPNAKKNRTIRKNSSVDDGLQDKQTEKAPRTDEERKLSANRNRTTRKRTQSRTSL